MTTTTAPVPTPTWGTIPTGTEVTIVERIPGRYLIREGRRTSALLTATEVTALTTARLA